MDISQKLLASGIKLENVAKEKFGAITPDGIPLAGQIVPPNTINQDSGALGSKRNWDPTPYSSAIASGNGNLDPRVKFLFNVEFNFDPVVAQMAAGMHLDPKPISENLSFIIQKIDLPKYEFAHEEVNMYNFRTKVLKQISHKELSFSLFDDIGNNALNFLNIYLKALVPISRNIPTTNTKLEDYGLTFNTNYVSGLDTSNRAVLPNNSFQIIRSLKIHQIYIERSETGDLSSAAFYNTFTFTNPRLLGFDISDQDHEASNNVNIISMNFDYDALNIETKKEAKTFNGVLNPNGDIFGRFNNAPGTSNRYNGLQIANSGANNSYNAMRAQSAIDMSGPSIDRLPGMTPDQDPLTRIIRTQVEKAINRSGGFSPLQNAIYRTMSGQSGNTSQGIYVPPIPGVKDNSTAREVIKLLSKKVRSDQ